MCGTDLQKLSLGGADLPRADLTGANLTETKLHDADLTEANLTGANLTGANLRGAVLRNAIHLASLLGRARWGQAREIPSAAPPLPYGAVIAAGCLFFLFIGSRTI